MADHWISVPGIVVQGHRVASGPSDAYPYGALEKQKPYFKALGLDLDPFYAGTLNVSIAPRAFRMAHPQHTFPLVEWTDLHPPETFSFSRCRLHFQRARYDGWLYYPHPETKKAHFQDPSLLEVIAPWIPDISYGDPVEVEVKSAEVILTA